MSDTERVPPLRMSRGVAVNMVLDQCERHSRHRGEQWKTGGAPNGLKLAILTEEIGEVARALQDSGGQDSPEVLDELVQVTAVGLSWICSMELEGEKTVG